MAGSRLDHLGGYRAFFALIENPLEDIDLFLMREQDEAERVLSLGAAPARVQIALVTPSSTHSCPRVRPRRIRR